MSKIPNINCKYYTPFGHCNHPTTKRFLGIFKPQCYLISELNIFDPCDLQVKHERPKISKPISMENVKTSSGAYRFKYCQKCGYTLTDNDFSLCSTCDSEWKDQLEGKGINE